MSNTNKIIDNILGIVQACDSVILCTNGHGKYPECRHMMNALNMDTTDLDLHFITTVGSPKHIQIKANPYCCLYYFNPVNRHVVRLFGKMEFVHNADARYDFWRDDYMQFGYTGPDDKNMELMHFVPHEYKFYIGDELHNGQF